MMNIDEKRPFSDARLPEDLPRQVLDSGLLGEDVLPTFRHAASQLLAPGYRAVPWRATVHAVAVESRTLRAWQRLRGWRQPAKWRADEGDGHPHDVVLEKLLEAKEARLLSEELHVFHFDFEELPATSRKKRLEVKIDQSGRLDAMIYWWSCYMVRGDKEPAMSNAPSWASKLVRKEIDHWRQAVCVLPGRCKVRKGETLRLWAFHNDEDLWFRLSESKISMPKATSLLGSLSPSRLWMLSESRRYRQLQDALCRALKRAWRREKGVPKLGTRLLDLSDGFVMSSLASYMRGPRCRGLRLLRLGRTTLISLESSREDLEMSKDLVRKRPRRLRVRPVLGSPSLVPESISILCGEPFARACEESTCDSHFWHHWAQVDALRFSLRPQAELLPQHFRLRVVLITCPELWRRRQEVTLVQGVDVSAMNRLHPKDSGHSTPFACSLWQLEHSIVSAPQTLCQLDMAEPFPSEVRSFRELHLVADAKAHGLATWSEVWLGSWVSTARVARRFGPAPARQGVVLAPEASCSVAVQSCFNPLDGALTLRAQWKRAAKGSPSASSSQIELVNGVNGPHEQNEGPYTLRVGEVALAGRWTSERRSLQVLVSSTKAVETQIGVKHREPAMKSVLC